MKKYTQVEMLRIIKDLLNLFRNDTKRSATLLNKFRNQDIKIKKDKDGKIISVELKEIPTETFNTFVETTQSYIRSFATEKAINEILAGTYTEPDKESKKVKEKVQVKVKEKAKVEKTEKASKTSKSPAKIAKQENDGKPIDTLPTPTNATHDNIEKLLKNKDEKFIKDTLKILVDAFSNDSRLSVTIDNILNKGYSTRVGLILIAETLFRRKPNNKLAQEAYILLELIKLEEKPKEKAAPKAKEKAPAKEKAKTVPKTKEKAKVEPKVKEKAPTKETKEKVQKEVKPIEKKPAEVKTVPTIEIYTYDILEFDANEMYKNPIERKLGHTKTGEVQSKKSLDELLMEFETNKSSYLNIKNEMYLINNHENLYIVGTNVILNILRLLNDNKIPFSKKPDLLVNWNKITKKYGNVIFSDLKEFVKYQYEIISNIGNKAEVNLLNRELLFEFIALAIPADRKLRNPGLFFIPYFVSLVDYDFENLAKTKVSDTEEVIQFTINSRGINFVFDNEQYSIDNTREDFYDIKEFVEANNTEELRKVLKNKAFLEKEIQDISGDEVIKIIDNKILCNNIIFTGNQVLKYLEFMKSGKIEDMNILKRFLYNLSLNPEVRAQEELFNFVTVNNLRITNHGTVILYKWVRNNYRDQHTDKFDNKPGSKVWMDRKLVDNNKNNTCSRGLHLCSFGYSKFSDKLLLVELHPRDCVSIPTDYNHSKMRCSEYKVLIDITEYYNEMCKGKDFLVTAKDLHHNPMILEEQVMAEYPNIKRTNSFTGRNGKVWADIKDDLTVPEEFEFKLVRGEEVSDEEIEKAFALEQNKAALEAEVDTSTKTEEFESIDTTEPIVEEKVEEKSEEVEQIKEKEEEPVKMDREDRESDIIKLLEYPNYNGSYKKIGDTIIEEIEDLIKDPNNEFEHDSIIANQKNIEIIINKASEMNLDKIILNRCIGIHYKGDKQISNLNTWKLILIDYLKTVESSNSIIKEQAEYTKIDDEKIDSPEDDGFVKKIGSFFGKMFK